MVVLAERPGTRVRETARGELAGFAGPALLAREPDERLAALVREGDANAFAAIVARYRLPLERHCRRTLPPGRAEDALQQTFASAYVALSKGAAPASLRPWLYAIAHNAAVNGLRDRQAESLDEAGELGALGALGGAHQQPHDIVAGRESLRSVVRAVVSLPARQRQVIVRQEFEGHSQEQIAAELGLTTGAVRQLAHRARSSVRAAAAAIIPAPIWRVLPWELGSSGGGELVAGSALAAVAGKAAIVLLMAGVASGAVEMTAAHRPATSASPASTAAPGRSAPAATAAGALPAAAPGAGIQSAGATSARHLAGLGARPAHGTPGARDTGHQTAGAGATPSGDSGPAAQPDSGGAPDPAAVAHHPAPAGAADSSAEVHGHNSGATGAGGSGTSGSGAPAAGTSSPASNDAADVPEVESESVAPVSAADPVDAVDPVDAPDPVDPVDPADTGASGVNRGSLPRAEPPAPSPGPAPAG
ncbi:MAG: hypothetical protein QOE11_2667 [Solirubrobacteraceae bacterium]|jgi:RNA polymerase sigma factor (sigma-70 family)|nr:hypothetical protein [Solirubrobacteraceae bacterium]